MIREFFNLEMLENYAEPGDVAHAVVMSGPTRCRVCVFSLKLRLTSLLPTFNEHVKSLLYAVSQQKNGLIIIIISLIRQVGSNKRKIQIKYHITSPIHNIY